MREVGLLQQQMGVERGGRVAVGRGQIARVAAWGVLGEQDADGGGQGTESGEFAADPAGEGPVLGERRFLPAVGGEQPDPALSRPQGVRFGLGGEVLPAPDGGADGPGRERAVRGGPQIPGAGGLVAAVAAQFVHEDGPVGGAAPHQVGNERAGLAGVVGLDVEGGPQREAVQSHQVEGVRVLGAEGVRADHRGGFVGLEDECAGVGVADLRREPGPPGAGLARVVGGGGGRVDMDDLVAEVVRQDVRRVPQRGGGVPDERALSLGHFGVAPQVAAVEPGRVEALAVHPDGEQRGQTEQAVPVGGADQFPQPVGHQRVVAALLGFEVGPEDEEPYGVDAEFGHPAEVGVDAGAVPVPPVAATGG